MSAFKTLNLEYFQLRQLCAVVFLFSICDLALWTEHSAAKTNQALYEDPFDQAAGGAALTRGSQDAVMFANPAVMPFGKKFFRWFGSQFSIMAGKDSVDMAKKLSSGSSDSGDSGSDEEEEEERAEFFDRVFDTPLHFGLASAISFITNNMGVGVFARFEPDILGRKHDETGLPEFRARAEAYGGAVTSFATALTKWLSLGATAKYLYKTEPDISLSLSDQEQIDELRSDPQALQTKNEPGNGLGFDAGLLLFLQGYNLDYRLALKVDDLGDTQFSGEQSAFKQSMHVGTGITLHNAVDSLHLSLDFRDITGAYTESLPLRLYTGAKLILRNFVGLAAGFYQGYPTYGIRLDLIFLTVGATYYAREMGEYAGDDGREIYVVYFGLGI